MQIPLCYSKHIKYHAVPVPLATNRFQHITIQISGAPNTESSAIHVSKEAYEKVVGNESCSIFACVEGFGAFTGTCGSNTVREESLMGNPVA